MGFKRKLAVTTLVASMVAASFAGLPLSNSGIMAKIDMGNVAYAEGVTVPGSFEALLEKLQQLNTKLTQLFPDSTKVTSARSQFNGISKETTAFNTFFGILQDKIKVAESKLDKKDPAPTASYIHLKNKATVAKLFESVVWVSLADSNKVRGLDTPEVRQAIDELGRLGGLDAQATNYLSYSDLVEFAGEIEKEVRKIKLTDLLSTNDLKEELKSALENALKHGRVGEAFTNLGFTSGQIFDVFDSYISQVPDYNGAIKLIAVASVSMEAKHELKSSQKGKAWKPSLTFGDQQLDDLISDFLIWSVDGADNSLVSYDSDHGQFEFSRQGSVTGKLKATIDLPLIPRLNGLTIYYSNEDVRLTYSTSSNPPTSDGDGGGGDDHKPEKPEKPEKPSVDKVKKDLEELIKKLEKASAAEKAKILEDALKDARKALEEAGKLDISKQLKKQDDKSIAQLTTDDLKKQLASLQQAAKELSDKLKQLGVQDPKFKLALTIDFGQLATSAGEVTLPKDVIAEAKKLGFADAVIVMSGITVSMPVGQFTDDVTLEVTKRNKSAVSIETTNTLASDIIDFKLAVGGTTVTTFEEPIMIQIPLGNINGLDKELLSVGKIVDGTLQIVGGRVVENTIVENRDTFSSYVVVENKVTFTDIDKVKSWAGRQIQVMAAKGAVEGKAQGVFAPQDFITRAEFAKMLISALDLENRFAVSNFKDVQEDDWYAPYVAAAVKHGIIHGKSVDRFAPNETITRAEMAAIIARALKVTKNLEDVANPDTVVGSFSDASEIHASLKLAVALATSKGLVNGKVGKFSPKAYATRAEAAVILYRAFNFSE